MKERKPSKPESEYALYRGDEFVDIGSIGYLSEAYGVPKKTLSWLASPSIRARMEKRKATGWVALRL